MTEFIVKSVAFNYSPVEDRVSIKCVTEESTHQLWLTQRMLHQLLPALIKWLTDAGFSTSQTKSFVTSSLQASQRNAAKKLHLSKVDDETIAERTKGDSQNQRLPMVQEAVWLCSKVNLSFGQQRVRMRWESEVVTDTYLFSMSSIEASHFLMVLRDAIKDANWSCHWPEWLPLVEENPPNNTAFLH